jgi:hypothetical protein
MALTTGKGLDQKGTPSSPHMTLIGARDVKAGAKIWTGGITFLEISSGTHVPALTVANAPSLYRCAGIAGADGDNTAGQNGDKKIPIERGTFILRNGTGGDALAATHLYGDVYAVDDELVANNNAGGTRVRIGEFLGFDESGDPIVAIGLGQ